MLWTSSWAVLYWCSCAPAVHLDGCSHGGRAVHALSLESLSPSSQALLHLPVTRPPVLVLLACQDACNSAFRDGTLSQRGTWTPCALIPSACCHRRNGVHLTKQPKCRSFQYSVAFFLLCVALTLQPAVTQGPIATATLHVTSLSLGPGGAQSPNRTTLCRATTHVPSRSRPSALPFEGFPDRGRHCQYSAFRARAHAAGSIATIPLPHVCS